ncbi:MAG: hypothetical protein JXL97_09025 [Bacteroidales bacterium]|nr:hypothetical protein [Bacteroidales bacterium]
MKYKLIPFNKNDKSLHFTANIEIINNFVVKIKYEMKGNIADVIIPEISNNPKRLDNLWEQTCFELFIGEKDKKNYYEVNLSPSKDWNVFTFEDYRIGKNEEKSVKQVNIIVEKANKIFKLSTSVDFSKLLKSNELVLGISAMIFKKSNKKEYWAIKHSGSKPDFHLKQNYETIII